MNVLALGELKLTMEYERAEKTLLNAISNMNPTQVVTDFRGEWNSLAASAAYENAVRVYGAIPYWTEEHEAKDQFINRASARSVFFDDPMEFVKRIDDYHRWLDRNIDGVLACVDKNNSSFSLKTLLYLESRGKTIFNFHGG